jgi:hypothetical protein
VWGSVGAFTPDAFGSWLGKRWCVRLFVCLF